MIAAETVVYKPDLEAAPADRIRARQLDRLNALLGAILPHNRFYARKLGTLTLPIGWDDFSTLPFTTKPELIADQLASPPLGAIATFDRARYVTYHQTSGTTGNPLMVLDTRESWEWWIECWQYVYHGAGVTDRDRLFLAFSFGPFIGFWAAHAAGLRLGAMGVPGGGLDSRARLRMLRKTQATVLLSTPTYALRLAEVARQEGMALAELGVRATIHAGEPGGSIPAVRARIEAAWGARCFDHAGATEVGAYGFSCETQAGLHLIESEFIAEVLDPTTGEPVGRHEVGELIITNLGRAGWPAIRYRTGDLVRVGGRQCPCGRTFLMVPGGIIGRADDLMIIRGINIYPSSIRLGRAGWPAITNLGRAGWPAIRYRTGDLVRVGGRQCPCGRTFLMVPGGIIGRADDLMIIRGINIYPSSIEAIVRDFDVGEFRIVRTHEQEMEALLVEVEASEHVAHGLAEAFSERLAVRIPTTIVPAGSLPRFELKAKRVVDKRNG